MAPGTLPNCCAAPARPGARRRAAARDQRRPIPAAERGPRKQPRKLCSMIPQVQSKQNARIGRDAQAKIGRQLRAMYAELIKQELPESLRELVRRLGPPQQP